ncbi:unnamed protein product [Amoebophrya sp. A25]|nr:unnamed protein product [Amoebophrya sp. A25]|eukprot:GSA25T00001399001.1
MALVSSPVADGDGAFDGTRRRGGHTPSTSSTGTLVSDVGWRVLCSASSLSEKVAEKLGYDKWLYLGRDFNGRSGQELLELASGPAGRTNFASGEDSHSGVQQALQHLPETQNQVVDQQVLCQEQFDKYMECSKKFSMTVDMIDCEDIQYIFQKCLKDTRAATEGAEGVEGKEKARDV